MPPVAVQAAASFADAASAGADAVVFVAADIAAGATADGLPFAALVKGLLAVDGSLAGGVSAHVVAESEAASVPGRRLILSATGPLSRDYDDARRVTEAVVAGLRRAKAAGATQPLLVLSSTTQPKTGNVAAFEHVVQAALIAAAAALYAPLTVRTAKGEAAAEPVTAVHVLSFASLPKGADVATLAAVAMAVEAGRRVARDIGGGDPEAMAPPKCADYITAHVAPLPHVTCTVVDEPATILKEYPLMHAVARASLRVPRHCPRVVRLEFQGPPAADGAAARKIFIAGKGVTYDTGGADVKTGGHMAGMSRDKCGAAAGAGWIATLSHLASHPATAPLVAGLSVVAYLGWVRNSIGADAYVADEIITSYAGTRVLVVNTDAEGRMVLGDLLGHIREEAVAAASSGASVVVHTLATLTGHAIIACGGAYSIAVENGVARAGGIGARLAAAGGAVGDPFELSTLRREDFAFVAPGTAEYDVKQGNNAPSVSTPRGHQFPAAFMLAASKLDAHGLDSALPLPFAHIDIAGPSVEPPFLNGQTTGVPIAALTAAYVTKWVA